MQLSVKQGISSVLKPFQRSKMFFKFKRDQKCKIFPFWAKTVKVAKNGVLTEKYHSGRVKSVNKINFGFKLSFQQVYDAKVSRKCFKN